MSYDTFNPATGLPMTPGDPYGVDVGGNPFGLDYSINHDPWIQ